MQDNIYIIKYTIYDLITIKSNGSYNQIPLVVPQAWDLPLFFLPWPRPLFQFVEIWFNTFWVTEKG